MKKLRLQNLWQSLSGTVPGILTNIQDYGHSIAIQNRLGKLVFICTGVTGFMFGVLLHFITHNLIFSALGGLVYWMIQATVDSLLMSTVSLIKGIIARAALIALSTAVIHVAILFHVHAPELQKLWSSTYMTEELQARQDINKLIADYRAKKEGLDREITKLEDEADNILEAYNEESLGVSINHATSGKKGIGVKSIALAKSHQLKLKAIQRKKTELSNLEYSHAKALAQEEMNASIKGKALGRTESLVEQVEGIILMHHNASPTKKRAMFLIEIFNCLLSLLIESIPFIIKSSGMCTSLYLAAVKDFSSLSMDTMVRKKTIYGDVQKNISDPQADTKSIEADAKSKLERLSIWQARMSKDYLESNKKTS